MKKVIMKFGGTSVGSGEHIQHVASLISNYIGKGYQMVVVVSALKGVTDNLIEASEEARSGNRDHVYKLLQKTTEKHVAAAGNAIKSRLIREEVEQTLKTTLDELEKVLTGIIYLVSSPQNQKTTFFRLEKGCPP